MAPHSAISSSQMNDKEADHHGDSGKLNDTVGVRFRPKPSQLVCYLAGKAGNKEYGCTDEPIFSLIKYVEDFYEREPSELKSEAHDFGDGCMYFFTHIQKKHGKGSNFNRETKGGCWVTGRFNNIVKDDEPVATERNLTYHRIDLESRKPTEPREKSRKKTQWLMKEYLLLEGQNDNDTENKTLALCVVYFHETKRKQRDNEDNESSQPDVQERKRSASSAIHPPLRHSSSNYEADTLKQGPPTYSYTNMPNTGSLVDTAEHPNVFNPSPNYNPPNPAAPTFEQPLPSPWFNPNVQYMMNEPWVETVDHSVYTTTNSVAACTLDPDPPFSPISAILNTQSIISRSCGPIATAPNHNLPSCESSSNPAASTFELLSSNTYQNMQDIMNESCVDTADQNSNLFTPTLIQDPLHSTTNPAAGYTFDPALHFSPNSESRDTPNIINESWNHIVTAPNHNLPSYQSSSYPAASPPELLSSTPYQNMPGNPADSNVYTLNPYPSTSSPLYLPEFLDQDLIMNQNQDPSGLTSAESTFSWYHALNSGF